MFGVIAEDKSDIEFLKCVIRRIAGNEGLGVHAKGYNGCSEMLRKGAAQLRSFHELSKTKRYVVCYDADKSDPESRFNAIVSQVLRPASIPGKFCALVPVQELEAWILADIKAVQKVILNWAPDKDIASPELVNDPKEYLEKMSRLNQKPRYVHAIHNGRVAKYLDLEQVAKKCPSFGPLVEIVRTGHGNALSSGTSH